MVKRGLQIVSNFLGDYVRFRQIGGVFEAFVSKPKYIEVHLVALREIVIGKRLEALALFSLVPVLWIEASNKLVKVGSLKRILLERKVLVCSQVVEPECLRPRRFACRLAVEEKNIGLHSLRIEDPGRQPE